VHKFKLITNLIVNSTVGFTHSGKIGAGIACSAYILDEFISKKTNKEFYKFSSSYQIYGSIFHNSIKTTQSQEYIAPALALSFIGSYFTGDVSNFYEKLEPGLKSSATLMELTKAHDEKDDFNINHPVVHFVATHLCIGLISFYIKEKLSEKYKSGFDINPTSTDQNAEYILKCLIPSKIIDLSSKYAQITAGNILIKKIVPQVFDKMYLNNNFERLMTDSEGEIIASKYISDVSTLMQNTDNLSTQLVNLYKYTSALSFFKSAQAKLPYATLFFTPAFVLNKLLKSYFQVDKSVNNYYTSVAQNFDQHVSVSTLNVTSTALRDAGPYYNKVINNCYQEMMRCEDVYNKHDLQMDFVRYLNEGLFLFSFNEFLKQVKSTNSTINLGHLYSAKDSSFAIFDYLSSFNAYDKNYQSSIDRIEHFLDITSQYQENSRSIKHEPIECIMLDNYKLKLNGSSIVSSDHLEIPLNGRYVLKGNNGSGKTSMLTDWKIGAKGALSSEGTITLPIINSKNAKITFIDQNTISPPNITLFELCLYPYHISNFSKEQLISHYGLVTKLMDELKIDTLSLSDSKDQSHMLLKYKLDSKEYKLSGGQKQKIAIIQAIISSPDILILDESFSNMNSASIELVQKALIKYLPNTTIISVDHRDVIDTSFYTGQIKLAGGEISLDLI
jgi:ABC-type uncharacterized transport system fused permease/ATPase subunit